jgi:multidrug efflux system membrane fusion protein
VEALGQDGKTVIDNGVLELVDNEIDQTTGSIKLKSTFPNKNHMLWPGGFTNARLLVSTEKNVLTIPSVAVQRGPQGTYVFALQSDKTVKMENVTVGLVQGDTTVITDGLKDGEQVVTDGMVKLQNGSKVALQSDQKKDSSPSADQKSGDGKKRQHKENQSRLYNNLPLSLEGEGPAQRGVRGI